MFIDLKIILETVKDHFVTPIGFSLALFSFSVLDKFSYNFVSLKRYKMIILSQHIKLYIFWYSITRFRKSNFSNTSHSETL